MPKVFEIAEAIERLAPVCLAEDYDNVGLLVGNEKSEVSAVMLCIDVTPDVVVEAARKGCGLVVSHHPVIFRAVKSVFTDTFQGKILASALKNNVSLYAAHTNLDNADEGLCRKAAEMLGLAEILPLCEEGGAVGKIDTVLRKLAEKVSDVFGDETISYVGDPNRRISSVAVVTGAGGGSEKLYRAALASADAFVSAEFKHHLAVEAQAMGRSLVQFSHFDSEKICINLFEDCLSKAFPELRLEKFGATCPFINLK